MEPRARSPRMVRARAELRGVREDIVAILRSVGHDEAGHGDQPRVLRRKACSHHDEVQVRNWELEYQRLRYDIAQLHHAMAGWQRQFDEEMKDAARKQGEVADQAAHMLQHAGQEMYEFQEDTIRRTAVAAEMLLSEESAKVQRCLNDSRNEEQHAVEMMREEARSFNANGLATRQHTDFLGSVNEANARNA